MKIFATMLAVSVAAFLLCCAGSQPAEGPTPAPGAATEEAQPASEAAVEATAEEPKAEETAVEETSSPSGSEVSEGDE